MANATKSYRWNGGIKVLPDPQEKNNWTSPEVIKSRRTGPLGGGRSIWRRYLVTLAGDSLELQEAHFKKTKQREGAGFTVGK
ncbi:hypothetical protein C922_05264 [Plasmodium inui San Antonio 1]|uniref:Uncharacterized protein n=1 Tax=Plasmodium inui San Antonio 1 TaxID=1237626 RepID=W7AGC2_9APIC|nr:hypothetical protein C922_05264 [Plasmodium inui San Antonio 1]EUD64361.1 hypothetical protein C922_05264 [Plasmodium inui San Antonio 1]